MDVQLRKIHFVKEFLRLNNEQAIEKLESVLRSEKKRIYENEPTPISTEELNNIIEKAEDDVIHGRVVDAHELRKDIDSWS